MGLGGLLSKATNAIGLTGRADAGKQAHAGLSAVADRLRNFKPIRVRSGVGTGELTSDGLVFNPTAGFSATQQNVRDFFGNATAELKNFNAGDSEASTLALLRQQRAGLFDTNLSRLESRLQQQGRLGLATGASAANPELQGFFSAEADADLNAQLAAKDEARRKGAFLQQQAGFGFGLMQETELPFQQGLFQLANLNLGRDTAAANVDTSGVGAELKGKNAEQDAKAAFSSSFFGSLFAA